MQIIGHELGHFNDQDTKFSELFHPTWISKKDFLLTSA